MPRAVEPFTLNEHRELASELLKAHTRLRELSHVISEVYGPESRAAFSFERATEAMERMRREMQAQALADWPKAAERLYL